MPNSLDLDCFIAKLALDWSEYYSESFLEVMLEIHGPDEAPSRLEKYLVQQRELKALKQSSMEAKKTQTASASAKTIVYNLRTDHDLKLYASLKTASPQLKHPEW